MIANKSEPVTSAEIMAFNQPDSDHPNWVAGTYALDALVTHNERNWKSTVADNVEEPSAASNNWSDQGVISKLAPFDLKSDSVMSSATMIEYQIKIPDKLINAIGFLNVVAESIDLIITDAASNVVYENSYKFIDYGADDLYDWAWADFETIDRAVDLDLPVNIGDTMTIRIHPSIDAGLASIGVIVFSEQIVVGDLQFNYAIGIEDYSLVTRDGNGTTYQDRGYAETLGLPVLVNTARVHRVQQVISKLRGQPVLWVGCPDHPETIIFGYVTKFGAVVPNAVNARYQIDLIGAI